MRKPELQYIMDCLVMADLLGYDNPQNTKTFDSDEADQLQLQLRNAMVLVKRELNKKPKSFEEVWEEEYVSKGYSYGSSELENVRFGWLIANDWIRK